jgi:hypothetical protein
VFTESQLRGYILEETLAWLLGESGYALLMSPEEDPQDLAGRIGHLRVRGRGATHQADVLGQFAFTPAFALPVRLFLEAKFRDQACGLDTVRNAFGVIQDVDENYRPDPKSAGPGRRFQYRYALFSTSGFTLPAQQFALAHQISLVDLSGESFSELLGIVRTAARDLHLLQRDPRARHFPLSIAWLRTGLRSRLGTDQDAGIDELQAGLLDPEAPMPPEAGQILDTFSEDAHLQGSVALMLGFPSAPFIVPLATRDRLAFLHYAEGQPSHRIELHRTHKGNAFEWVVSPSADSGAYQLHFTLPEALETWISDNEERKRHRVWTVKNDLLANIMVYYRAHDQGIRACQLRYEPGELRRS